MTLFPPAEGRRRAMQTGRRRNWRSGSKPEDVDSSICDCARARAKGVAGPIRGPESLGASLPGVSFPGKISRIVIAILFLGMCSHRAAEYRGALVARRDISGGVHGCTADADRRCAAPSPTSANWCERSGSSIQGRLSCTWHRKCRVGSTRTSSPSGKAAGGRRIRAPRIPRYPRRATCCSISAPNASNVFRARALLFSCARRCRSRRRRGARFSLLRFPRPARLRRRHGEPDRRGAAPIGVHPTGGPRVRRRQLRRRAEVPA